MKESGRKFVATESIPIIPTENRATRRRKAKEARKAPKKYERRIDKQEERKHGRHNI